MDDSDRRRIGAQAAADQSSAAAKDYAEQRSALLDSMGAKGGKTVYRECDKRIVSMINDLLATGIRMCDHQPATSQMMFWNPRLPVLLCQACNEAEATPLAMSYAAEQRCDVCGTRFGQGNGKVWGLRSMVLGAQVIDGVAYAACLVTYLACPACREQS